MKIQDYLSQKGVSFTTHQHPPAYTAQEVAAEEHVSGKIMAKTVVVKAGEKYVMCVLPACYMLDMDKVAKAVKAKSVRLADESELADMFPDSEVGAEPPFGNLYDLPTIVDAQLAQDEEIVFQADTHRDAVRMRYADYASLVSPSVEDIAVAL
jgi:Ala-tRNA(Pro) deacylase